MLDDMKLPVSAIPVWCVAGMTIAAPTPAPRQSLVVEEEIAELTSSQ